MDEVDEDGNGEISFEEFKLMMYKMMGMQSLITNQDESNQWVQSNSNAGGTMKFHTLMSNKETDL